MRTKNPSRAWHKRRLGELERQLKIYPKRTILRGMVHEEEFALGPMGVENPKSKCPRCGTFMKMIGLTRAWGMKYKCPKCGLTRFTKAIKPWQRAIEQNKIGVENPRGGGNPMTKKKRSREMNIMGIPIMTAAIIGGLAYWLFKKQ